MAVNRWSSRALLLGLLVVAGFLAYWFWLRPDPITWQNYGKIEEGMTAWQVLSLLGPPRRTTPASHYGLPQVLLKDATHVSYWHGEKVQIQVFFGSDGRVRGKIASPYSPD
jgi:hypothetical protein